MYWFLEYETANYALHSDKIGNVLLHRRCDGHECYFQGDDADLWRRNVDAIVKLELARVIEGGWRAGNSLDKSFDFLCSGYDDVLCTK